MAYTTINKSTDYFNTKLYTGNGSAGHAITGVGFQPDWTWIKSRNITKDHMLFDAVRGVTKALKTNQTSEEDANADFLTAFGTDGFTVGNNGKINTSSDPLVSWNWKAGGSASSNSDGSITSTVSANTTAGFSIVSYTGTGSAGTIGHGLGSTPKMIIVKCRSDADTWAGYHVDVGATKYLELDTTAAAQTSTQPWNDTEPTSSVFTVGNWSATNGSSKTYIAYCFAEKTGYSKFGSYVGNGSSSGTYVHLGFKPAFLIIKKSSATEDWGLIDNKRDPNNDGSSSQLFPNGNNVEDASNDRADFLSNGFKLRTSSGQWNTSGGTYIYMAFGQSLVGSNNVPCKAR